MSDDVTVSGLIDGVHSLVRRRWRAGLAIFGGLLGLVVLVLFTADPVHRTEARLRLGEPPPMGGVSPTAGIFGLWRMGGDPFANDLELLRSRSLAESVVDAAGLNAQVRARRSWSRDSLFLRFEPGRETERARYRAEWTGDGRIRIARTAPSDSAVGVIAPGERAEFGGLTVVFRPRREGTPRRIEISTLPFAEAVRLTRQRLGVERVRREANVVDLSFNHTDEGVSQAAARAMVEHFIALRTAIQRRESGETVDSLRLVAQRTAEELRQAETSLEAFQRESRLLAPQAQSEVFVERYGEAVALLAEARSELEAIGSLLRRAESTADPARAWTEILAHRRFLDNETMGALVRRLTELESQRKDLARRRTEESIEYRFLVEQIDDVDTALRSIARSYEAALREEIGRLDARVAAMDAELAAAPADAIELGRRTRDVRLLSEVLVLTEQRLRQEELREALTFANIQVVDPPALRDRPVWPRKKLGLAVGFLLASALAMLGMVVVERADRGVRRASDVRAAVGAPVLAAVAASRGRSPHFDPHEVWAVLRQGASLNGGPIRLTVAAADGTVPGGEVARALLEAAGNGREAESYVPPPRVTAVLPLNTYAAAAEAAADGAPVALVAMAGRTRLADLERAARLLEDAGGRVAGVILVCARRGDRDAVWE